MKACPQCGGKLEAGTLLGRSILFWSYGTGRSRLTGIENGETLAKGWFRAQLKSKRCGECRILLARY